MLKHPQAYETKVKEYISKFATVKAIEEQEEESDESDEDLSSIGDDSEDEQPAGQMEV